MKPYHWVMSVGIFLLVLAVYWLSPIATSMDSALSVYFTASLVKTGDLNIDEYRYALPSTDYRMDIINGHIYSHYPIGAPLMSAPIFSILDQVVRLDGLKPSDYLSTSVPDEPVWQFEKLLASIIVSLNAIVIFALALEYLDLLRSLLLVVIFSFATSAWSTASRALWQHGPSMLCLSMALYLLVLARRKPYLAALASLPLAFSYIARPTNGLSIAILTVYIFFAFRRYFVYYLLGLVVVFTPFFIYSYSIYSQLTPLYYSPERFLIFPSLSVMMKNLFSPSRGLFIFSPILLFSLYGMYAGLKNIKLDFEHLLKNINVYLVVIIILHWITISANTMWYAGWSIGPRLFTDMMPYFVYFLIPLLAKSPTANWTPMAQNLAIAMFILLLVFSIFVQFRSSTNSGPILWNALPQEIEQDPSRLSDWSDIQFLRNLCPEGEYRAPACWFSSSSSP